MNKKFVAFDIETLGSLEETQGVTCASTCTSDGDHRVWAGAMNASRMYAPVMHSHLQDLIVYLSRLYTSGYDIISWNGLSFDFRVIQESLPDFDMVRDLALKHIDPAFHMLSEKGFMCGLDAAAQGFSVQGKTEGMNGEIAAQLWLKDRVTQNQILEYVAQDAKCTRDVYAAALRNRSLFWITKTGKRAVWTPKGRAFLPVSQVLEAGFVGKPHWWSTGDYPWDERSMTAWLRPPAVD